MTKIEIYGTRGCPYCRRALAWLDQNELKYEFIDLSDYQEKKAFYNRTGTSTVPQIYVGTTHIGGWTDLWGSKWRQEVESGEWKQDS